MGILKCSQTQGDYDVFFSNLRQENATAFPGQLPLQEHAIDNPDLYNLDEFWDNFQVEYLPIEEALSGEDWDEELADAMVAVFALDHNTLKRSKCDIDFSRVRIL